MLSQTYMDGDYHLDYLSILEGTQEQVQNGNTNSSNDSDQKLPNP